MTQQEIKLNVKAPPPPFGAQPTWFEVYAYWHSKNVPQVEVVDYDSEIHDERIPWFERHLDFNDRRGFFYLFRETPKVDTAFALVRFVSRGGPTLYAAFAIMTTLRHLDEWTPLVDAVRERIDELAPDARHGWHPNAKRVLPVFVEGGRTFRKDDDWRLRVDLAARVWTEIAERFQVVRQPLWMQV